MRTASAATLANLASGQWQYAELYDIQLPGNSTPLHFSGIDSDLTFPSGVTYKRGFVIARGALALRTGVAAQTVEVTFSQLADSISPALIAGITLQQCADRGLLDNATVTIWEAFLASYADTSPGLTHLFKGRVSAVKAGRLKAIITVTSGLALLDVDMPRNVVQSGCVHALYDAGCTLSRAAFTVSGVTTATPGVLTFDTTLTQVGGYFALGQIDFLTGPNAGVSRMVRGYSAPPNGTIRLFQPLAVAPNNGDRFNVSPGCKKTQAQCSNASLAVGPAFNNIAHFRGAPYIPVPETLYDGGTVSPATPASGRQGAVIAGSQVGHGRSGNQYVP